NANNSASQLLVTKLDSSGAVQWTRTASGGTALGSGVAVDSAENVYAAGVYAGTVTFGPTVLTSLAGGQDVFLWKLNAGGSPVWAGSVGGTGTDWGAGMAVDGAGNVVMTGAWGTATNVSSNND